MQGLRFEVVDDLAEVWVPRFVASCHHAVAAKGRFTVALAGGRTPMEGYRRLSERGDLPWERVWLTWGDERFVPASHPDRNARAAFEALLDHVAIDRDQVFTWPEAATPEEAASLHAANLAAAFGAPLELDLVLLGLGADGHTASLFPGTGAALDNATSTLVVRPWPDRPARLSLSAAALSQATEAWVLVSGEDKRPALGRTLEALRGNATADADVLPLTAVQPRRELWLLVDRAAAGDLAPIPEEQAV